MVSPGSSDDGASAAAAVCCMCGDQGLPSELFQCAICLQRLQYRYDLPDCMLTIMQILQRPVPKDGGVLDLQLVPER
jgi:hypothetical protein